MISKLILAAQDVAWNASDDHREQLIEALPGLSCGRTRNPQEPRALRRVPVRSVLAHDGPRRRPAAGLTGQVKEDVLGRLGECGVHVAESRLGFRGGLSRFVEPVEEPTEFRYVDAAGSREPRTVPDWGRGVHLLLRPGPASPQRRAEGPLLAIVGRRARGRRIRARREPEPGDLQALRPGSDARGLRT